MKERDARAEREPAAAAAVSSPVSHASASWMTASPSLMRQGAQIQRLTGGPAPAVQREEDDSDIDEEEVGQKPDFDGADKWRLDAYVASRPGCCLDVAGRLMGDLRETVRSPADIQMVLLTWAARDPKHGTLVINNHAAVLATWDEGTFVVDTTSGQFGGERVFVGSRFAWVDYIGRLRPDGTFWRCEIHPQKLSAGKMQEITEQRYKDLFGQPPPSAADDSGDDDDDAPPASSAGIAKK